MAVRVLRETFNAWIDEMPGSQPTFIVTGAVEHSPEEQVHLVEGQQGINPDIKILEIRASRPGGTVPQSRTEVRYPEKPAKHPYTQTTIRNGSEEFTIPVGRTS